MCRGNRFGWSSGHSDWPLRRISGRQVVWERHDAHNGQRAGHRERQWDCPGSKWNGRGAQRGALSMSRQN